MIPCGRSSAQLSRQVLGRPDDTAGIAVIGPNPDSPDRGGVSATGQFFALIIS